MARGLSSTLAVTETESYFDVSQPDCHGSQHNNAMHAKPDLRVRISNLIYRSGLGEHCRYALHGFPVIARLYKIDCKPFSQSLAKKLIPVWRHILMVYEVADHTDRVILETSFDDENNPSFILASEHDPFGYRPVIMAVIDFPFVMSLIEKQYKRYFDPALAHEYDPVVDAWIRDAMTDAWDLPETKKLRKLHVKRGNRLTVFESKNGFQRQDGIIEHVAGTKPFPLKSLPHRLIQIAGQDAFSVFVVETNSVVELDFSTCDRTAVVVDTIALVDSLDRNSKSLFSPSQVTVRRDSTIPESELKALQKLVGAKKIVRVTEKQAKLRQHKRQPWSEKSKWFLPYAEYSRLH